jgi:hypothetical protein
MRKLWGLVVLPIFSLVVTSVYAQDIPKIEVFGGFEYLHVGSNSSGPFSTGQGFNGWNAAADYRLHKFLAVEGDFGGAYTTIDGVSTNFYTYTGGPMVGVQAGPIKPFVHALFGDARLTASPEGISITWNGFTAMAGGGLDAKINPLLAVRVIQFDWLYYHFGSKALLGGSVPSFSASNNVRISTGVVLRF